MEDFLQKLPVDALWGVGPKTAARLRAAGIERLVDVRSQDDTALATLVGSMAEGAARWLEKRDTLARTVRLKMRYQDFRTITRAHSAPPTRDPSSIIDRAVRLVDKT